MLSQSVSLHKLLTIKLNKIFSCYNFGLVHDFTAHNLENSEVDNYFITR
jgi:hypothetical protein